MLKFLPYDLLNATWHLGVAQQDANRKRDSTPSRLAELDREFYQEAVNMMRAHCERLELNSALDQVDRMDTTIKVGSIFGAYHTFSEQAQQLFECMETDLGRRLFMFMPLAESKYYEQEELFGPRVKTRFPEANKEIVAAGNCYATGNYTACVFHLMRVTEMGARAMVTGLKVQKYLLNRKGQQIPVELCDWQTLITALQKGVDAKSAGAGTNTRKKKTFEFYNHALGSFRNFKDAWRNHVSHTRERYLPGKTQDIMDNTRQLMQHLATRLSE
jgi:hypothetical protein